MEPFDNVVNPSAALVENLHPLQNLREDGHVIGCLMFHTARESHTITKDGREVVPIEVATSALEFLLNQVHRTLRIVPRGLVIPGAVHPNPEIEV